MGIVHLDHRLSLSWWEPENTSDAVMFPHLNNEVDYSIIRTDGSDDENILSLKIIILKKTMVSLKYQHSKNLDSSLH